MSLDDFSTITVAATAPSLSQVGFGTLGILAYHTKYADYSRVYEQLTGVVSDGFDSTTAAYKAIAQAFAQNPRVQSVKLLRAESPATVTYKLFPVVANSTVYAITLQREGHAAVEITYTSDSGATAAEITAGLKAAVDLINSTDDALDGVTATQTDTNANLTVAAPEGIGFFASKWRTDRMTFADITEDPGIEDDLATVAAHDDDWYGLGLADTNSVDAATAAAHYIESVRKMFGTNTSDSDAFDSGTTSDIGSVLATASRVRSFAFFDLDATDGYSGIAALANLFPFDPGTGPFAGGVLNGRTLGGVTADALTPTQKTNLENKGYSVYITTAKINHVLGGRSGSREWIDFTRFVDWFVIRLQERLATMQFNSRRVPFDARGLTRVLGVLKSMIATGLASGGIAPLDAEGNAPSAFVPELKDTNITDRGNRVLNGCSISFEYSGAIQKVGVTITVTE